MADNFIFIIDERFPDYCEMISDRLAQKKNVSIELMDALLKAFADTIYRNAAMPNNFHMLASQAVSELEHRHDRFTVSPGSVMDIVYALYFLVHTWAENDIARQREEELRMKNSTFRKILTIVGQEKRIRHKELAQKLGITPSALTQHLGKNDYGSLITAFKPGREKIYLLTDRGQTLLKQLDELSISAKENDSRAASAEKEVSAKIQVLQKRNADLMRENKTLKKKLTRTRKKQPAYQRTREEEIDRLQKILLENVKKRKNPADELVNQEEQIILTNERSLQRALQEDQNIYQIANKARVHKFFISPDIQFPIELSNTSWRMPAISNL